MAKAPDGNLWIATEDAGLQFTILKQVVSGIY
jgi:hypothetical protein